MEDQSPIFCSLDLELTGFDPSVDEILEVGFVLFTLKGGALSVIEEWSSIFKPVHEVRSKILALTGIPSDGIEQAPLLADYHGFLKSKLTGATLVGHSISVDARFLEAANIASAPTLIDTLELVQFILPTHHGYNLESLMHYFGIPHKEAHRALADARATISVLQKLIDLFHAFPSDLKREIRACIQGREFAWESFFLISADENIIQSNAFFPSPEESIAIGPAAEQHELVITPRTLLNYPLVPDFEEKIRVVSGTTERPTLLVMREPGVVLHFYRQGLVTPLFPKDELFNEQRFQEFAGRTDLNKSEILFILKIYVWKYTNWQKLTVLDINWSALGSQFKSYITGGSIDKWNSGEQLVCTDYSTFLNLYRSTYFTERQVIIESIDFFERFFSEGLGLTVGWNKIDSIFKTVYNPETGFGDNRHSQLVIDMLAATDLFFGLVIMLLKSNQGSLVDLHSLDSYLLGKIRVAAANYIDKLDLAQSAIHPSGLVGVIENLRTFFAEDTEMVRWMHISDTRCTFFAKPASIAYASAHLQQTYPFIAWVSELQHGELIAYYSKRLQLETFQVQKALIAAPPLKALVKRGHTDPTGLTNIILQVLPTVVLFNKVEELRSFYDRSFVRLKAVARVFALGYSGGVTKMFRNFSNDSQSILLATPEFFYRQTHFKVATRHIIFVGTPELDLSHPYIAHEANHYEGGVEKYAAIKRLDLLYSLVKMCHGTALEQMTFINIENPDILAPFFNELPNIRVESDL